MHSCPRNIIDSFFSFAMQAISVQEAYRLATSDSGAVIVDVRELGESEGSAIPGAIALPLTRFLKDFPTLQVRKKLLFICASGGRSSMAAEYMESQGHQGVANVAGGVLAWEDAGLPFEEGKGK